MEGYKTRANKIPGITWGVVSKRADLIYSQIVRKTKRRPYVRSAYFKKQKIFLTLFWAHLFEKQNIRDKTRRVKYFACALELIQNSHIPPTSKENPNHAGELLHRFFGTTAQGDNFVVQIKEVKRTGQKWLISVFPKDT